jgi:hypothetical protein
MRVPKRTDVAVAAAVFAVGFALFWMFRALGWFAQDEGVLYYHYLRTHRGQTPYRDFFTGYGPVTLYLHSLLFSLLGVSIDATRVFMAGLNATSGVLLYLVTRRLASPLFAVVPALLFFTQQPGDIADMAFHNTPYPLWYLVTLFALAAWALLRAIETSSPRARAAWMFAIGVVGGVALFTKQNGGIFLLWGATGFLASHPMVPGAIAEGRLWRAARAVYLSLIPLSMLLLSWTFASPLTLAAYVAPTAALAWIGASRRFSREAIGVALRCSGWIALGGAVATVPWIAYFAGSIGVEGYFRALFLWGKYVDRMIYLAYPMPGQLAAFALAAVLVPWYCTAVVQRHGWRDSPLSVRLSVGVAVAALVGGTTAFLGYHWFELRRLVLFEYNPWRMYREASLALDSAYSYLSFPVILGGVLLARRQSRGVDRTGDPPAPAFLSVLWMAVCAFLLYYPRMDAAHFVSAAVLLYCVAAALVELSGVRLAELAGGRGGARLRRACLAVAAAFVLFAVNLKMAPKVYSVVMLRKDGEGLPLIATPREEFAFARVNVYFPIYEKTHRQTHRAFVEAMDYVRAATAPDEPIFAFPAYPMVYFASERDNPTRHDYFLSNNVPFDEQVRLLDVLERSAVQILVLPSDENDYFVDVGRPYHNLLWAYFRQEYYLERRFGPYDVWRRFDGAPPPSAHS